MRRAPSSVSIKNWSSVDRTGLFPLIVDYSLAGLGRRHSHRAYVTADNVSDHLEMSV